MYSLTSLLTNKTFISVIAAVVLAQLMKTVIYFLRNKKFNWATLIENGNFPSSHTAVMAALTISIYFTEGFSLLFIVCFAISGIIIRDALGIRYDVQKHAMMLKKLTRKKVNENIGHTPWQVVSGIILGIIVAAIVHLVL